MPKKSNERREYERYKILADLIIHIKKKKYNVIGYDFSQGGIGFVTPEKLPLNEKVAVEAKAERFYREGVLKSKGQVSQYPGMYKYGLEFFVPLTRTEASMFVQRLGKK
ncbi:MAG: PilZ domain-containing protein [Candidatus Hydrogenedentota bacterium]|nr:MAG: PilZ domain-containing protein [Candidatus Hydrogenedentota bacterium]